MDNKQAKDRRTLRRYIRRQKQHGAAFTGYIGALIALPGIVDLITTLKPAVWSWPCIVAGALFAVFFLED